MTTSVQEKPTGPADTRQDTPPVDRSWTPVGLFIRVQPPLPAPAPLPAGGDEPPAALLAGEEEDGFEPHILRGID